MSRFLLSPSGTSGDVHPYVAVGCELKRRGHEVFLLTNPAYEEVARQHSLDFVPIGEGLDWSELRSDARIHSSRQAWKAAMQWGATGTMREVFAAVRQFDRPGQTAIAAPAWNLGARIAREALSVPLATLVINPFLFRSVYQSPITPQMYLPSWMPRWMKSFQYWFGDAFYVEPLIGRSLREFRNELGLPTVTRWMNRWWFSPDLLLALFNEVYAPRQPDWPSHIEFVGHTATDPDGDPSINAGVQQFLDAGSPPICFVPGSVGPGSKSYYDTAIEACTELGVRGLILDKTDHDFQPLPPSMFHARYSPLRSVLPKCRAIAHSGCAGTATQGLLAGIPHLIRPCVNDQPDVAQRLHRLGVAEIISTKQFKTAAVVQKLRALIDDKEIPLRCQEVQSIVARDDAVNTICNRLERLI
ncbi:MAG: glycosyltransferase [Pirellulaceae bacterium]|nr:glycosyltransferase [Pirellulaceae bacterium]